MKSLTDWSGLPKDLYVTSVDSDGIVFNVYCCSVPMALGPEVRYSQVIQAQQQQKPIGWFVHVDGTGFVQVAKEHEGEEGAVPLFSHLPQGAGK